MSVWRGLQGFGERDKGLIKGRRKGLSRLQSERCRFVSKERDSEWWLFCRSCGSLLKLQGFLYLLKRGLPKLNLATEYPGLCLVAQQKLPQVSLGRCQNPVWEGQLLLPPESSSFPQPQGWNPVKVLLPIHLPPSAPGIKYQGHCATRHTTVSSLRWPTWRMAKSNGMCEIKKLEAHRVKGQEGAVTHTEPALMGLYPCSTGTPKTHLGLHQKDSASSAGENSCHYKWLL